MPPRQSLRENHQVRVQIPALAGEHRAAAAEERLRLVVTPEPAVLFAEIHQGRPERIRRYPHPRLACYRLDHHPRHRVRGDYVPEYLLAQVVDDAGAVAIGFIAVEGATVRVRVGDVDVAAHQLTHVTCVARLLRSDRLRRVALAVVLADEGDDVRPVPLLAHEPQRGFDRFGPAHLERDPLERFRCYGDELLGQFDYRRRHDVVGDLYPVIEQRLDRRPGHVRMRGPDVRAAPSGDHVHDDVAVHVLHDGTVLTRYDDRHHVAHTGPHHLLQPPPQFNGAGSGRGLLDDGCGSSREIRVSLAHSTHL